MLPINLPTINLLTSLSLHSTLHLVRKVLIVDDDLGLVEIFKAALEKSAYQVLVAANGKVGIEIAKKELPDLILLDIIMPDINGIEVLRILKADKITQNLKVAIITNFGQEETIKQALNTGAVDVLLKYNFGTEDLIAKVTTLIHEPASL